MKKVWQTIFTLLFVIVSCIVVISVTGSPVERYEFEQGSIFANRETETGTTFVIVDKENTYKSTSLINKSTSLINKSTPEVVEDLIGKWKVDRLYSYGVGSSKNDEQTIKKLIGTEIIFSSNSIKFGKEKTKKPIFYKVSKSSDESFFSDMNWLKESTVATDLNLQSLKEISVYEDAKYEKIYYGDANIMYYTINKELILNKDGDLFLLVKSDFAK
ncbi:hypothetical protein [Paenibacillus dauci]|uniref:hypothetical protein n=1 Tax=Paenibacillus dauci TaxID=1567106 RepID=UPI000619A257|nr:hypothetical protein [Paenibacillus dauci]